MKRLRSHLQCGGLKLEGVSTAKIALFHQGSTELRWCANCVFFLPVNILTGVTRRLLGPHDHHYRAITAGTALPYKSDDTSACTNQLEYTYDTRVLAVIKRDRGYCCTYMFSFVASVLNTSVGVVVMSQIICIAPSRGPITLPGGAVLYHMRILYRTRMVCIHVPYAYGTIFRTIRVRYRHTRMVRTICVLCFFSVSSSLAIT